MSALLLQRQPLDCAISILRSMQRQMEERDWSALKSVQNAIQWFMSCKMINHSLAQKLRPKPLNNIVDLFAEISIFLRIRLFCMSSTGLHLT